jgi:hypothetical protein
MTTRTWGAFGNTKSLLIMPGERTIRFRPRRNEGHDDFREYMDDSGKNCRGPKITYIPYLFYSVNLASLNIIDDNSPIHDDRPLSFSLS